MSDRLTLLMKKLHPDAKLPTYGSDGAIGLDLYALNDGFLVPMERRAVLTGVSAAIPDGWYGRVAPRSGTAIRGGIDVLAGVIDDDYRGDISVMLINLGDKPFTYQRHDRVGQLILERADKFKPLEVSALPATARGESGFGSTGR